MARKGQGLRLLMTVTKTQPLPTANALAAEELTRLARFCTKEAHEQAHAADELARALRAGLNVGADAQRRIDHKVGEATVLFRIARRAERRAQRLRREAR